MGDVGEETICGSCFKRAGPARFLRMLRKRFVYEKAWMPDLLFVYFQPKKEISTPAATAEPMTPAMLLAHGIIAGTRVLYE